MVPKKKKKQLPAAKKKAYSSESPPPLPPASSRAPLLEKDCCKESSRRQTAVLRLTGAGPEVRHQSVAGAAAALVAALRVGAESLTASVLDRTLVDV